MYYNEGSIKGADGVVIYINEELKESTSTEVIKEVAYINTCILLKNGLKLNIASTYRSHGISKVDFIQTFKEILNKYKKAKNHFIVGDFNIDILKNDKIAEDYTNELLEGEANV